MNTEIALCFKYIVPVFREQSKSILITVLMSSVPDKHSLPHELNIDGISMILESVGEVSGITENGNVKFTLYPIDIESLVEGEEVIAPVSAKTMEFIIQEMKK